MSSKTKKIKKLLLFSPIIIAAIIVLLSALFSWRNIDLGFQITPSMRPYLGQLATIKLDVDPTSHFVLLGDLHIEVQSGEEFEVWVSPFLEIYAESYHSEENFYIRSVYAPSHEAIAESIRIVLPKSLQQELTLEVSGSSTLFLQNLSLQHLILDTLGKQRVYFNDGGSENLSVHNLGNLTFTKGATSGIANLNIHNKGNLAFSASLMDGMHQLHNTGNAHLTLTGSGSIDLSGIGTVELNQQRWQGFIKETYQLK